LPLPIAAAAANDDDDDGDDDIPSALVTGSRA